jgi:uncharacterized protein Smg (DUF494 family)
MSLTPKVMDAIGLIGRYVQDHWENFIDHSEILSALSNEGFSKEEISHAFKWIEQNTLGLESEVIDEEPSHMPTIKPPLRVLGPIENAKLTTNAFELLTKIYNRGLIDAVLLEEIIDRLMRSESEEVGELEARRVAALTLFNRVQSDWRELLQRTNTLVH